MILDAVLFDLDDTLYPQRQWLDGAWRVVAERAAGWDVDPATLRRTLQSVSALGIDRGGIVDTALRLVGRPDVPVAPLVEAFRHYAPLHLEPYPDVVDTIERLAADVPLGLVTDGEPGGQRAKLDALALRTSFTVVVCSDELGRAHRKPDPLPFQMALRDLGVGAPYAVHIGDRPAKDVAGAVGAGLPAVRVRTGEWRAEPDDPRTWASVANVTEAGALVDGFVRRRAALAG
jgi:putative hydrolase of the HAD superfamily